MNMQTFIMILLITVIGAAIGGYTNYLAIRMLFKPYHPVYIGKWRLPFTPGLIPRRRDELAEQMGKLVVNHLLTADSIKRKFLNDKFQGEMTVLVQTEVEKQLNAERSLEDVFNSFNYPDIGNKTELVIDQFIEKKYEQYMEKYRNKPLHDVMPKEVLEKAEAKIPVITLMILQKAIDYFSSIEGNIRIQRMVDDFVRERNGMLGNMLQMLAGNMNLADKIQPEIIKFLKNEGTSDLINTLLKNEWHKLLEKDASFLEDQFEKEKLVGMLKRYVQKAINVNGVLQMPISQLTEPIRETIIYDFTPKAVGYISDALVEKVEGLMEKLRLADIVRDQVSSFSVERLEEMLFSIIKKELRMITFLGAFLGGLIGIVQGAIALMF